MPHPAQPDWEIIIVGGSAAGLAAALTLGRARRRVLVLDAGRPCNRFTPHSHNLFTRDGVAPAELLRLGREQALAYPTVALQTATVTAAERTPTGFRLTLADGVPAVEGRKLLLATGVVDQLPDWPGMAECWGKTVVHCPYCHGYELPAGPVGVVANGESAIEYARLVYQWNPDLRLFTQGPATLPAAARERLAAHGVPVTETPIVALEHTDATLRAALLVDGTRVPLSGLYFRPPNTLSGPLATQLGCTLTETGLVQIDAMGLTDVPGVAAAGDCAIQFRGLSLATAGAVQAAASLNHQLAREDF